MTITILNIEYVACLQSMGAVMFLDTWYPTQGDLELYPHNEMTYQHHWNPHQVQFPRSNYGAQEEIEGKTVATVSMCFSGRISREIEKGEITMKDVPTVLATMGYTSANGRSYILVFNEALYMKDMEHTLMNPKPWHNFGA